MYIIMWSHGKDDPAGWPLCTLLCGHMGRTTLLAPMYIIMWSHGKDDSAGPYVHYLLCGHMGGTNMLAPGPRVIIVLINKYKMS